MALSPKTIRQRVAAAITGTLGPDGWAESSYAFDLFGRAGREISHLEFAVGVPRSTPTRRDEQRRSNGAHTITSVSVKWGHALRVDAQVEDYDASLDAEARLIEAALTARLLRPELVDVRRTAGGDGTILMGQVDMLVPHLWTIEEPSSSD